LPGLTQRVALIFLLLLVGKVKDNLKLSVWDEPSQQSLPVPNAKVLILIYCPQSPDTMGQLSVYYVAF
jgi:hypothetical protein